MKKPVLVTGGAGYIGSHACVAFLEAGYEVVVLDNLSNSKREALNRVEDITGKEVSFVEGDLLDGDVLNRLFDDYQPGAVVHFAGLKAVAESVEKPVLYWRNNVGGTANLLQVMQDKDVCDIVFSSSCTVYGMPDQLPVTETAPRSAVNPYGSTKLAIEDMLIALHDSDQHWNVSLLRYFNPVGAHPSGDIGEDPLGIPNNLMPYITQTAVGIREKLSVFGDDYETRDGTCIRDYIHVLDLVDGHLKALEFLRTNPGLAAHNLGTGKGHTVLEMVVAFESATGVEVPYEIVERRPGDAVSIFADPTLAQQQLGWKASRGVEEMCRDAWNWQQKNPGGY